MATIDLMDQFSHLGEGGIRDNGTLDDEAMFQPSLRTMRTDFIQVKAGDSIVYKNMNGMSSIWNILSFYTGDAQGFYVSGIAGQTTPQSGVWTAQQDGYVRLFGSFPAGDKISVTMTDLAPDVEDYLSKYNAMNYRFLPNSIPKIVAHIQEYLSNHPIADSTTLQAVIDAAFKSYLDEIQQTADTYIAEAVPPAAAAAVDAAASPALAEITAKTAEAAESARQAGLSQQSAEMSEENALTYRNQAQQIKDSITAEVSASVLAAQEQATLAQESAQAADESADSAEQYVAQARAQAAAAAAQAQTASGYASDAQGYMQDASGYADNAAQSAATFSTDPTLTISGKAADAKATGDELSALKSAFNAYGNGEEITGWQSGYINLVPSSSSTPINITTPTASSTFRCVAIECNYGDAFTLDVVGGNSSRAYAFLDTSKVIILRTDAAVTVKKTIYAPYGAKYLVINDKSGNTSYIGENIEAVKEREKAYNAKEDTELTILNNVSNKLNQTLIKGHFCRYSRYITTGQITDIDDQSWAITDYIPIPTGTTGIVHNFVASGVAGWAFFDINKNYVSGGTDTTISSIPEEAYFILLTNYDSTKAHSGCYVQFNGAFQTIVNMGDALQNPTIISCFGDSVTQGMQMESSGKAEYGGDNYPSHLLTMLVDAGKTVKVNNYGHSSETSYCIGARIGTTMAYLSESVTIPSGGSASLGNTTDGLKIKSMMDDADVAFKNFSGRTDTNPILVGTYLCNLSVNNGAYTISLATTSASAVTLPAHAPFVIGQGLFRNCDVAIVYQGLNNWQQLNMEKWMKANKDVRKSIEKTFVIGPTTPMWFFWSDVSGSTVEQKHWNFQKACFDEFGVYFIDLYDVMSNMRGLEIALAAGKISEITQADITAVSNNQTPPSLTLDGTANNVHFNDAGYYVMAKNIYDRITQVLHFD